MGYGTYRTGAVDGTQPTPNKIPGAVEGGPRRSFTELFDLSKANVDGDSGDVNFVARIPEGHAMQAIKVRSTVSLTTSTLAFGTKADDDAFGTAAAYGTTAEAEKEYLLTAKKGVILDADTDILMKIGTADLPATGVIAVEVITSARG
jgi:hypothetical protein